MANISLAKLVLKDIKPEIEQNINGVQIKIKTYLPIEEKLDLIASVVEKAGSGEQGFYNIIKLRTFWTVAVIKAYTNIAFTPKQLESETKLYDTIVQSHIYDQVAKVIGGENADELSQLWADTCALAKETTEFNHSALGILRAVSAEYNNSSIDLSKLQEAIKDPESLKILKEIAPLLGEGLVQE